MILINVFYEVLFDLLQQTETMSSEMSSEATQSSRTTRLSSCSCDHHCRAAAGGANLTFITPGDTGLGPLWTFFTHSSLFSIRVSLSNGPLNLPSMFSSGWCFVLVLHGANGAKLSVVCHISAELGLLRWESERCGPVFVSVKQRPESRDAGRRISEGGFSLERNLFPLTRLLTLTRNTTFTSSWAGFISSNHL